MPIWRQPSRRCRLRSAAVATVLLATCGGDAAPPTALPVEIEGFRSNSLAELDAREVAADAIDVQALATLLDSAGFGSAIERSYTGPGQGIRRMDVRIVRFSSEPGAERYLAWQREHVSDVIGDAKLATEHQLAGAPIYLHMPDGCCTKETVLALAMWRKGPAVVRVLVAGPGADGAKAASMIEDLYRSIPLDA